MEERFLFNWVWMNGTGISINQTVIFSIPVFPHPANPSLSLGNAAAVRAQFTLDFSSLQWSEIGRKFCLDKPLLSHLCAGGLRQAKEIGDGEHAETCPAQPQKLSFCKSGIAYRFGLHQLFKANKRFTHSLPSFSDLRPRVKPNYFGMYRVVNTLLGTCRESLNLLTFGLLLLASLLRFNNGLYGRFTVFPALHTGFFHLQILVDREEVLYFFE